MLTRSKNFEDSEDWRWSGSDDPDFQENTLQRKRKQKKGRANPAQKRGKQEQRLKAQASTDVRSPIRPRELTREAELGVQVAV